MVAASLSAVAQNTEPGWSLLHGLELSGPKWAAYAQSAALYERRTLGPTL